MKLFRQLLVAPAALGLLLPLSAGATEVNINGISSYSNIEEEEERFFSHNDFSNEIATRKSTLNKTSGFDYSGIEAGSFSSTTTMNGSASFLLSAGEGDFSTMGDTEALTALYYYGIDLNTSFTGEDNLAVTLEAGNTPSGLSSATVPTTLDFGSATGDALTLVDINYTRSFGDLTVTVGDSLDVSSNFTGACAYSGLTDHLADCGTGQSAGAGGDITLSSSYDLGKGFTFGAGFSGLEASTTDGFFTKESADLYAFQLAYSADNYGLAVSYSDTDVPAGEGGSHFGGLTQDTTFWGINGYFRFDDNFLDSISVGYEMGDPETGSNNSTTNWFAGVSTAPVGPGAINLGVGTTAHVAENAVESLQYEASYAWSINDSISATAGAFIVERATAGVDDLTGYAISTTFTF